MEKPRHAKGRQHPLGVGARRVGQDEAPARQALERSQIVRAGAQPVLQAGQPVRVVQEMRGAHAVVAHQPGHRRAVIVEILLLHPPRLDRIDVLRLE